ncbi:DUF1648 domain-containing protein [Spirosoma agri]|uniref:DUF1648 domain-containing protein n=1 Tax=Spirosoma agri TaxID=1987381 RepID=A0A6M0IMY4_9BACT|nr:DUF1648 domain-containing protein [Spirosoma agri]NEU69277.1 DUF1648 domain-containing protein [Spirosoma agri]
MSSYERKANRLTIFLLVVVVLLSIGGTVWLPGPIPIHFNGKGEANRWGSPATLLVLAFVCSCVVGLFWLIRRIPTEQMNFPGPRTPENVAQQRQNIDELLATNRVIITGLFLGVISQIMWASIYKQKQIIPWPSWLFIVLIFASTIVGLLNAFRLSAER